MIATTLRMRDGKRIVQNGPFADTAGKANHARHPAFDPAARTPFMLLTVLGLDSAIG